MLAVRNLQLLCSPPARGCLVTTAEPRRYPAPLACSPNHACTAAFGKIDSTLVSNWEAKFLHLASSTRSLEPQPRQNFGRMRSHGQHAQRLGIRSVIRAPASTAPAVQLVQRHVPGRQAHRNQLYCHTCRLPHMSGPTVQRARVPCATTHGASPCAGLSTLCALAGSMSAPMRALTAPEPARQTKWLSCVGSEDDRPPFPVRHTAHRPSANTTACRIDHRPLSTQPAVLKLHYQGGITRNTLPAIFTCSRKTSPAAAKRTRSPVPRCWLLQYRRLA